MTDRIIYTNENGGVSIVIPTGEVPLEVLFQDIKVSYPDAEIVNVSVIPSDRTFRNVWGKSGKQVQVDMVKARVLWMNKIRDSRNKELAKLDLEYIRADEEGNNQLKAQIAAKKNGLRNIPQTLDLSSVTTPEQLKQIWPEGLPPKE